MKKILRIALVLFIITANIGCDQVSKNMVRKNINYYQDIELLNHHFTLTKVENSGAFLSLGDSLSSTARKIFLSALPLLALAFGFIYLLVKKNVSNVFIIGLSFVIGGGIGNIFDRITYGSVTDFMHIHFGIFQTGVFNLADVSIMTGAFIVVAYSLFSAKRNGISSSN